MHCSLVPAGSHPCSARAQQNLQVSKMQQKTKLNQSKEKKKKKAVLKMIPNTTSVPDFNSLQHRPRKCKLLWSELVAKYSPEGIQFSVLRALSHLNQLAGCQHSRLSYTVKGRESRVCTGGALVHWQKIVLQNVHAPQAWDNQKGGSR